MAYIEYQDPIFESSNQRPERCGTAVALREIASCFKAGWKQGALCVSGAKGKVTCYKKWRFECTHVIDYIYTQLYIYIYTTIIYIYTQLYIYIHNYNIYTQLYIYTIKYKWILHIYNSHAYHSLSNILSCAAKIPISGAGCRCELDSFWTWISMSKHKCSRRSHTVFHNSLSSNACSL